MSILIAVLSMIFVLGLLIFFHELGHFITAKFFGVRIEKFSLGFGKKLFGFKKGETEYLISAFPIGGYVKMAGETPGEDELKGTPDEFYSQSPLRRMAIVIAGPLFNIILAVLIYAVIFSFGIPRIVPVVGTVMKDMPAEKAGLKAGDRILRYGGKDIKYWDDLVEEVQKKPGIEAPLKIMRGSEILEVLITPVSKSLKNALEENVNVGMIGIEASGVTEKEHMNPFRAVIYSFENTGRMIALMVKILKRLVLGQLSAKNLAGFIGIAQLSGQQVRQGMDSFFGFIAYVSINLGVVNMLPLPPLDGGMIVFFILEKIMKRQLKVKVREVIQTAGIVLLIGLMVFVTINDIVRAVTKMISS